MRSYVEQRGVVERGFRCDVCHAWAKGATLPLDWYGQLTGRHLCPTCQKKPRNA